MWSRWITYFSRNNKWSWTRSSLMCLSHIRKTKKGDNKLTLAYNFKACLKLNFFILMVLYFIPLNRNCFIFLNTFIFRTVENCSWSRYYLHQLITISNIINQYFECRQINNVQFRYAMGYLLNKDKQIKRNEVVKFARIE